MDEFAAGDVAETEDQLDDFRGLQRSHDARQHTEHAAFRTGWHQAGRRRRREQAAVTRAAAVIVDR